MTQDATLPLRIGHVPGVTVRKWRTLWAERFAGALDVIEVALPNQRTALVTDEVDMCFVRLPIDRAGLHAIPLYDEVMVAWVGKEHVFAAADEISEADLAGETVLSEPDGYGISRVLAGAVLVVPMSIARTASRRDLVYRPITDAPPSSVALAWRIDNPHPGIDEFIGIVRGRTPSSSRTVREREASLPASVRATSPSPKRTRPNSGDSATRRRRW